jgi:hypothetical protein
MMTSRVAQNAANNCCGENSPQMSAITSDNVLEVRKHFLLNVAYNGKRSHNDIIKVLEYMTQFMD